MDHAAAGQRIIVSLDGMSFDAISSITHVLRTLPYAYKIHDFWDSEGSRNAILKMGVAPERIWVDLKLHDVPSSVAFRARAVKWARAGFLSVHASGGSEMVRAAVDAGPPKIFAVTVLTSFDEADCRIIYGKSPLYAAAHLAQLAAQGGAHGIVCSPHEIRYMRILPELADLELVVPGIRPAGSAAEDQSRFDTPTAAIRAGATRLVIGRPITRASDPSVAFHAIAAEIAAAMEEKRNDRTA